MKRNLYGKKMFIADLIIVSLWALFAWHEIGCGLVMSSMIVMRISLSFELFRKSRWASLAALMFAFVYLACIFSMPAPKYVEEPITKFIYVCLCLCGQSELAIVSFNALNPVIPHWIIWSIWGLISGWLVLMPIIIAIRLNGCTGILLRKRRLWWYMAFVLAVTLLFWFEIKDMTIFIFSFLMTLTPLAYRVLYSGRKRQLLQSVLRNNILMGYIKIAAVLYIAVIIGLYNIGGVKLLASFILPVVLYIIANRLTESSIRTMPAMMIGLGGLFFINCCNRPHELVVAWLCVGILLTLVGVVLTFRYSRNVLASILLFIASGFLLPVLLLGYNPYAVINADYVDLMKTYYSKASNGLYEFSENGHLGVRDRYGIVVPPKYDNLYFLEGTSDYMVLAVGERNSPGYRLQVFDLYAREYVIPEDGYPVAKIREIDYHKYALLDRNGEQIYTLSLVPGNHYSSKYETYFLNRTDIPHLVICKYNEYNDPCAEFSSNLKEAERQLIEIHERQGYCDRELMDLLQTNIRTLQYPFKKLQQETGITITTSADNKVRLYSWNTGLGGTSPEYQTYIQYVTGDTVLARTLYPIYDSKYVLADDIRKDGHEIYEGSFCDKLYQIPMKNGMNAYIVLAYNKASSVEGEHVGVMIYEKDGTLEKLPFIDKQGEKQFSVDACYYIPDWYFTTDGLGWDWVMSFDSKSNTLYVPESGDMGMSDRYDLYRFNDGKMIYIGNDAGYWLHPSLRDFKRLAGVYQTDTELIRIDKLRDDTFRYAAWSKSKPMSSEPELVLYGGKTGIIENAIVFRNDDYTYIVPEYRRGQGKDFGKVIIKYKNKVIYDRPATCHVDWLHYKPKASEYLTYPLGISQFLSRVQTI